MRKIAIILMLALVGAAAACRPGSTEADFKNTSYDSKREVLTQFRTNRLTTTQLFDRCMEAEGWQPAEVGAGYPSISL